MESSGGTLAVFAFVEDYDQAEQLREYMRSLGADGLDAPFAKVGDDAGVATEDIMKLISASKVVGARVDSAADIEMALNSLLSMISPLTDDAFGAALVRFCEVLSGDEFSGAGPHSKAAAAVRVLTNLFHACEVMGAGRSRRMHFDGATVACQFAVYVALLRVAGRARLISTVPTASGRLDDWFAAWKLPDGHRRTVLRALRQALMQAGHTERPADIMLQLLGTYDKGDDGEQVVDDARACVRAAVADANVFVLDHIANLEPVRLLQHKDADLWQLLMIFIDGDLDEYDAFMAARPNYAGDTLRMADGTVLTRKMRMLTLAAMANDKNELHFDELRERLHVADDLELEEFVIAAIQAGSIKAKIDQVQRKLLVHGAPARRFDDAQWEQLDCRLHAWANTLAKVAKSLHDLAPAVES